MFIIKGRAALVKLRAGERKKKHTRTPPPIRGGGVSNTLPRVIIMPCRVPVKPGAGTGLLPLAFVARDLVIDRAADESIHAFAHAFGMSLDNLFFPFGEGN